MEEPEVLEHICRYLNNRGCDFFVDSTYPNSVIDGLVTNLENCQVNRTITIGRRIPDIIGFNNNREIFAVEVKGERAIRKGIGQAAHYRQGVHLSYLAAAGPSLSEFKETAQSCGLGTYAVGSGGDVQPTKPVTNLGATAVDRTRRALAVKTSRLQSEWISFPSVTRPENALLPAIALATQVRRDESLTDENSEILTENSCKEVISSNEEGYNQPRNAIALATTLGLVKRNHSGPGEDRLELTDTGRSAFYLVSGIVESRDITDLFGYVSDLKNKPNLYTNCPEVASYLRDRYLAVPDVRLLVFVLASHDGSGGELTRILAEIALSSPDAFLNLFCSKHREDTFRELIEGSLPDPSNKTFRKKLLELTSPNSLYNFLYQIRHIELLTEDSEPVHSNDDLHIGSHHLRWNPEIIGELGSRSLE